MSRTKSAIVVLLMLLALSPRQALAEISAAGESGFQNLTRGERFLKAASTPGRHAEAVSIGRRFPNGYLLLLQAHRGTIPAVLADVVASDLELARGRRDAAIWYIRSAARRVVDRSSKLSAKDVIPSDEYLAETNRDTPPFGEVRWIHSKQPDKMIRGWVSGGREDNAILKRLIDLGCTAEASMEYRRVFDIHRRSLAPSLIERPIWEDWPDRDGFERQIGAAAYRVTVRGFNRFQLEFAQDYARFLYDTGQHDALIDLLFEVLKEFNLDGEAGAQLWIPIPLGTYRRTDLTPNWREVQHPAKARVNGPEFIQFAFGVAKLAGRQDQLQARLDNELRMGTKTLLRVFAVRHLRAGDAKRAAEFEDRYIEESGFPESAKAYRRALIAQREGRHFVANELFKQAELLPFVESDIPNDSARIPPYSDRFGAVELPYLKMVYIAPKERREAKRQFLEQLISARRQTCDKLNDPLCRFEVHRGSIEYSQNEEGFHLAAIQELRDEARTLGADVAAETDAWLNSRLQTAAHAETRAAILFVLGKRTEAAAVARLAVLQCRGSHKRYIFCEAQYQRWKAAFNNSPELLTAFVEPGPHSKRVACQAPWDLLRAKHQEESCEAIPAMRGILIECPELLGASFGTQTLFANQYQFATLFLRRLAQCGERSELNRLAILISSGTYPFDSWQASQLPKRVKQEDVDEALNALVDLADGETRETVSELWRWREPFAAKQRLGERMASSRPGMPLP